jgi:hypothetical protein
MAALTTALALLVVGCGGGKAEEGVSDLTYAPQPFYDDLLTMSVNFTTTGPAREGFEYAVVFEIVGADTNLLGCRFFGLSTRHDDVRSDQTILGEPGKTYTVEFKAADESLDVSHFCRGPGTLAVTSVSIDNPSNETSRQLQDLEFRVLPAP